MKTRTEPAASSTAGAPGPSPLRRVPVASPNRASPPAVPFAPPPHRPRLARRWHLVTIDTLPFPPPFVNTFGSDGTAVVRTFGNSAPLPPRERTVTAPAATFADRDGCRSDTADPARRCGGASPPDRRRRATAVHPPCLVLRNARVDRPVSPARTTGVRPAGRTAASLACAVWRSLRFRRTSVPDWLDSVALGGEKGAKRTRRSVRQLDLGRRSRPRSPARPTGARGSARLTTSDASDPTCATRGAMRRDAARCGAMPGSRAVRGAWATPARTSVATPLTTGQRTFIVSVQSRGAERGRGSPPGVIDGRGRVAGRSIETGIAAGPSSEPRPLRGVDVVRWAVAGSSSEAGSVGTVFRSR